MAREAQDIIESIQNAYHRWYNVPDAESTPEQAREEQVVRFCSCEEAKTHDASDGVGIVCGLHSWEKYKRSLQQELISDGWSIPLGGYFDPGTEKNLWNGWIATAKTIANNPEMNPHNLPKGSVQALCGNPYNSKHRDPSFFKMVLRNGVDPFTKARYIATRLSERHDFGNGLFGLDHIVMFMSYDVAWGKRVGLQNSADFDAMIKFAPVLVYVAEPQTAKNASIRNLVQSRNIGITFIAETE